MRKFTKALLTTSLMVAAAGFVSTSASATDGMVPHGVGARNSALGGAGVADQNDATALAVNPAGLVNSDTQLNISASLFSPHRSAYVRPDVGEIESDSNYFVIPSMFYNYKLDANRAIAVGMYAAGGMNTDYPVSPLHPLVTSATGQDLQQVIMSVGYAQRFGSLSVGIAPTVGIQFFDADGLQKHLAPVSDQPTSAVGIALRGGIQWDLAPSFRVGASGSTPGYVQAFNGYDFLFANGKGELEQAAYVQAGAAFDLMPNLTIMADYKRIFYGSSPAIADDFGWSDINIYKVGVEWDLNPGFTLRAGYSYNDNPLSSDGAQYTFANTLAPATVQQHFTGGAKVKMTDSLDLELAGMYAPEEKHTTDVGTYTKMYQYQATAGIVWHLGQAEAPLK